MKVAVTITLAVGLLAGAALAQQAQTGEDHEQHHPPGAGDAVKPAPSTAPASPKPQEASPGSTGMMQMMMRNMPEQCRAAMQNMPASCMSMMGKMMQGGMMQGGGAVGAAASSDGHSAHGASPSASTAGAASAPHVAPFEAAIEKMHEPMIAGVRVENPDVAFARGMIPHHQAAIDMALVVLKFGKDEKMRKLALDVIREQNREIAEMNEWLREHDK